MWVNKTKIIQKRLKGCSDFMTIGEALKEERQSLGLTQKEMIGNIISLAEYSKIENNLHSIDAETLFKILSLHQINISDFYSKIKINYFPQQNRYQDITYLATELERAFYKSDIPTVQKIQDQFSIMKNVPLELKLRAKLIMAVLKEDHDSIDSKTKKLIFRNIFNQDDWVKNTNSLRLFGNSMFLWDYKDISIMIGRIFKEYKNIRNFPNDVQERIGQICSNFLFNGVKYPSTDKTREAISLLASLDDVPHLILYKILGYYFKAYYEGNIKETERVKELLLNSGCTDLIHKFLK